MTRPPNFIGLDMGTTHTRGWAVVEGGVAATAHAAVGIRDAARAGDTGVLRPHLRELLRELRARFPENAIAPPEAVVAAGMITSDLGLAEVAHLPAPVTINELATATETHRFPDIVDLPVLLVPGVRTGPPRLGPESIGRADVMRGEETLCVGLLARGALAPGSILLNLGSHWKSIHVDAGARIVASRTSLAGEAMDAVRFSTVLAGSLPAGWPEALDREWARAGKAEANRSGLERALFCVRLLAQRTEGTAEQRLAFLAGAFVASALPPLLREADGDAPLVVAGGAATGDLLCEALAAAGRVVRRLAPGEVTAATVTGLAQVLSLHRQLRRAPPQGPRPR